MDKKSRYQLNNEISGYVMGKNMTAIRDILWKEFKKRMVYDLDLSELTTFANILKDKTEKGEL
jgi:hypothetical protein